MQLSDPSFPWPRHVGVRHAKEVELPEDLFVEQWRIRKGTRVKLINGRDFGFCIVPRDAVPCGIKRIFKY